MDEAQRRRWQRVDDLFAQVLELPAGERYGFLRAATADDPSLHDEVAALLQSDEAAAVSLGDDASSLLQPILAEVSRMLQADQPPLPGGGRIGAYSLIAEAGRGGMATVYSAERTAGGVQQRVALKLVNRGTDTDEVLRRFAHETRVLASLEHPNIARFYDAGASTDGRPYLVMEYIEGRPLTEYCDAARLNIEARLLLFRVVCEAVQYAHQNLVVHRDIKPSNILVTDHGVVKLLDFGIAKLLADEPDAVSPRTRTGIRILTPEYAAPEQIRGESISTATDVYALGVVLYELLAGARPHGQTAGVLDAPSAAVKHTTRTGGATDIALARATTAERLRRRLTGDLDRIVLKALESEPAQRYQSPQQLNDDLDRHARGMPVQARPATISYRLRKYARRHRAGLALAVAAVLVLTAFTSFHTLRITGERDRVRVEAAKARATTAFLQQLLGEAYPSIARGDNFSMSQLLARAVTRIDSLTAQPAIQAELLRTIGDVYREQGRFAEARPLLERAIALHRSTGESNSREAGHALSALGHMLYEWKDFDGALKAHRESLDVFEQILARDDTLVLFALNNIATAATALEQFDEALRLHEEVIARSRRLFADTSQLVHVTYNNLGDLHSNMGHYAEAEREFRKALRLRRAALPADHPALALSMNNLGSTLGRLERLEEAESLHREALATWRRVYGPDHHRVALSAYNLARVLEKTGQLEEADTLFRITIEIDRKTYGEDHLEVGIDLQRLGMLLRRKGDCAAAVVELRQAEAIFVKNALPLEHERRVATRGDLEACGELGK